jgi:PAS domain S-box-containing protein
VNAGDVRANGGTGSESVSASSVSDDSASHIERLQLLFDNMLEGYAYCRMLFGKDGEPEDFIYLEVNPAFGRLTGLSDVVGRRVTEIIPGIRKDNPEVFTVYGRVARIGEPEQFEVALDQLDLVLNISVFRPELDHFVAVFEDVTERKRAEQKLQELIRFLEHRVEERTNDLAEALELIGREPGKPTTPD